MSCFPPQELFKLQKSLPSSRFLSPAEIYPPDRVKFTVICVSTSTGSPFKIYGLYRHCLTASIAAGASMGKSTRLNSSHANISYAVFCLKKKNKKQIIQNT